MFISKDKVRGMNLEITLLKGRVNRLETRIHALLSVKMPVKDLSPETVVLVKPRKTRKSKNYSPVTGKTKRKYRHTAAYYAKYPERLPITH